MSNEDKRDVSKWIGVKCTSFEEMRDYRARQWRDVPFYERLQAGWELSKMAWKGDRKTEDEFRLQRSVANLQRGGS